MSGAGMFKVFVSIHAVDHASHVLLRFANLANQGHLGVAKINKQLQIMGGLAAMLVGGAGVAFMTHLGTESVKASMKVSQLNLELQNLGLSLSQISKASATVGALTVKHPSITTAQGLHLFKDSYSVLGDFNEARAAMPMMTKFQLAMRGVYGQRGDEMGYDAVRAAELQMGKNFNLKGLQQYLEVYTKVVNATGGRVDPQQIHGFMKNSVYGRMSQSPDALAKQIMLMLEMGGPRAGTAFNAIDRFAIGHVTQAVSKERMELWNQYGLMQNVVRNKKGKITDFTLTQQDLYQRDKVEWLYSVYAPALQKNGIDPFSVKGIPKVAQMFSTQTGAAGAITTLLQHIRNQKEVDMYKRASGINEGASRYESSPMGAFAGLQGAWQTFMQTLGTALMPVFVMLAKQATTLVQAMTAWIKANPELTRNIFLITTGFFALIGAIGAAAVVIAAWPASMVALGQGLLVAAGVLITGIVGVIALHSNTVKNTFRSLMGAIVVIVAGTLRNIIYMARAIPGLDGALIGNQAYMESLMKGGQKMMGQSPRPSTKAGHVSQKIDIHINGAKSPQLTASAVHNALRDLVHPKAGYGYSTSPNGMHGFTA
jgi:hypothetical protein